MMKHLILSLPKFIAKLDHLGNSIIVIWKKLLLFVNCSENSFWHIILIAKKQMAAIDELLHSLYYGNSDAAFAGINKLYNAAKKRNHSITVSQVKRFLNEQQNYQLFFENHNNISPTRSFYINAPGYMLMADTFYSSKIGSQFLYYLILIDAFTRYAYAKPLKTLKGPAVARALHKHFDNNIDYRVVNFFTDKGTGWVEHKTDFLKFLSLFFRIPQFSC